MPSIGRVSRSMPFFQAVLLECCVLVVLCQSDGDPSNEIAPKTNKSFQAPASEIIFKTTINETSISTELTGKKTIEISVSSTLTTVTSEAAAPGISNGVTSTTTFGITSKRTTESISSTNEGSTDTTAAVASSLSVTNTILNITPDVSATTYDTETTPTKISQTFPSQAYMTTVPVTTKATNILESSISVVGPRSIRRNTSYTVVLANSGIYAVQLSVSLLGTLEGKVLFNKSASVMVQKNSVEITSFETFELPDCGYRLSVADGDGSYGFEETIDLVYNPKTMSVFIQTDKPVYNPGDRIRFRVIIVDAHTRPVTIVNTDSIRMLDASGNVIMQWSGAVITNGMFSSEMQLASSPVLGTWTLEVIVDRTVIVENFEVIQKELPIFFVKVYPTETLLIEKKKITLTIESAQTFGQQIVGTARVELFLSEKNLSPSSTITKQIIASTNVEFTLNDEILIVNELTDFQHVIVKVSVTERYTNRTVNITQSIPVFRYPYKITIVEPVPPLHPGMPYSVQIAVRGHYGETLENHKKLYITVRYEGNGTNTGKTIKQSLDKHGLASLYLYPPQALLRLSIEVNYDLLDYGQVGTIEATESQGTHYIRATLNPRYRVRVNRSVTFSISSTKKLKLIWYVIMSRGCVVTASALAIPNKNRFNFRVMLTPEMAPAARLAVYTTVENVVMFDQLELNFESFNNQATMTSDSDEYQPGQNIYINVMTAQDSEISLQAIDQSVNSANGFNKSKVLKDLALYEYTGDHESDKVSSTGLFLRSTADTAQTHEATHQRVVHNSDVSKLIRTPVPIKTVTPQSWLWESFAMDGKRTSVNDTVPDTLTSWQITGFALSPTLGLGFLEQPKKIVVKQPFYIIAHIPYSVKRNEVTLVEVTLYNYIGKNLLTDVKLSNKKYEFEFVGAHSNATTASLRKTVVTPSGVGRTVSFIIKARKLGDITIKVQAKNLLASDAVEHILRVTPESHLYEKNEARFIELHKRGSKTFKIDIDVPQGIDEGSLQIKFTVDPNCLGTIVKNLESLIHLPKGCGEANMVNFVPNIVILDYLSDTSVVVDKVKSKALRYLKSGYQNELKFKRSDGSFSVWGRLDSEGSTFLTAFVAKSFRLAAAHIDIDKSIITNAFRWLADVQSPNGRFVEVGQVFHADIQSELRNNSVALTSYVLIAFLEDSDITKEHSSTVWRALRFLSRKIDEIEDAYDLALATYAFSLANHPKAKYALDKLIEKSTFDEETNVRYWRRASAVVEIAGYAILSCIEQDVIGGAMEIIHWLSKQRYGRGGYAGTQDTFVGLKALAKISAVISSQRNDYKVTIRHKPLNQYTINIGKNDTFAIQEFDLPSHVRQIQVQIDGLGYGMFQVAYQYYLNIKHAKQSFKLNVDVLKHTTYHVQYLKVCVKYTPREVYQRSNMVMVEVFFPSGLVADENSVQECSRYHQIRKTELRFAATSVVVYYDGLGPEASCFQVTAYRRYKVAENRPANVVVYDYYNQDHFAVESYEGKKAELCDICEDEECESLSCY